VDDVGDLDPFAVDENAANQCRTLLKDSYKHMLRVGNELEFLATQTSNKDFAEILAMHMDGLQLLTALAPVFDVPLKKAEQLVERTATRRYPKHRIIAQQSTLAQDPEETPCSTRLEQQGIPALLDLLERMITSPSDTTSFLQRTAALPDKPLEKPEPNEEEKLNADTKPMLSSEDPDDTAILSPTKQWRIHFSSLGRFAQATEQSNTAKLHRLPQQDDDKTRDFSPDELHPFQRDALRGRKKET